MERWNFLFHIYSQYPEDIYQFLNRPEEINKYREEYYRLPPMEAEAIKNLDPKVILLAIALGQDPNSYDNLLHQCNSLAATEFLLHRGYNLIHIESEETYRLELEALIRALGEMKEMTITPEELKHALYRAPPRMHEELFDYIASIESKSPIGHKYLNYLATQI